MRSHVSRHVRVDALKESISFYICTKSTIQLTFGLVVYAQVTSEYMRPFQLCVSIRLLLFCVPKSQVPQYYSSSLNNWVQWCGWHSALFPGYEETALGPYCAPCESGRDSIVSKGYQFHKVYRDYRDYRGSHLQGVELTMVNFISGKAKGTWDSTNTCQDCAPGSFTPSGAVGKSVSMRVYAFRFYRNDMCIFHRNDIHISCNCVAGNWLCVCVCVCACVRVCVCVCVRVQILVWGINGAIGQGRV